MRGVSAYDSDVCVKHWGSCVPFRESQPIQLVALNTPSIDLVKFVYVCVRKRERQVDREIEHTIDSIGKAYDLGLRIAYADTDPESLLDQDMLRTYSYSSLQNTGQDYPKLQKCLLVATGPSCFATDSLSLVLVASGSHAGSGVVYL